MITTSATTRTSFQCEEGSSNLSKVAHIHGKSEFVSLMKTLLFLEVVVKVSQTNQYGETNPYRDFNLHVCVIDIDLIQFELLLTI